MKKTAAKGHTRKHAHAVKKHAKTAKHHPVHHARAASAHGHKVTAKARHPAQAKARGLALDGVACCGAEALAASLRLAGVSVSAGDVLGLHRAAGAGDEAGAPIAVLLEAAAEYGLAGYRPGLCGAADPGQVACAGLAIPDHHSVILGVDLPGPHAVLATAGGWWSWGELWCPCEWPDAVIEEAWAVTWA